MVEAADRSSRQRAVLFALFGVGFLAVSALAPPYFDASAPSAAQRQISIMWPVTAVIMLALIATGGGLLNRRAVRALIDDEISRTNRRTAVGIGYWTAMTIAIGLYALPYFHALSTRETVYLIATPSIGLVLLAFSILERRAHRDE